MVCDKVRQQLDKSFEDFEKPIEALINEYGLSISYKSIKQKVEREINHGVRIKFPWIADIFGVNKS